MLPWVKAFERQKYSCTSISPYSLTRTSSHNLQLPSNLTCTHITLDNSNRFSSPTGVRSIDVQLYNVAHTLHIEERTVILCISCYFDNSNRFPSPTGVRSIDVQLYNVAHTLHIEERTVILCIFFFIFYLFNILKTKIYKINLCCTPRLSGY